MNDYTSIMCNESLLETRDHLFFTCPFAVNSLLEIYVPSLESPPVTMQVEYKASYRASRCSYRNISSRRSYCLYAGLSELFGMISSSKESLPAYIDAGANSKINLHLLLHKAKRKSYMGLKA
jgi:hypothetical protein